MSQRNIMKTVIKLERKPYIESKSFLIGTDLSLKVKAIR